MPNQARDDYLMKVFTELVGTDGVDGDRCWLDALEENKRKTQVFTHKPWLDLFLAK
jgi:hypothetical protein